MNYDTKLRNFILIPSLILLVGVGVLHIFGEDWDTIAIFWFCFLLAVGTFIYMMINAATDYAYVNRPMGATMPLADSQTPQIPTLRVNGIEYASETEGVKINKGKQVAQTIFSQYKGGLNVDLTERYWVGSKKFTRTEWIALLDEWKKHGLIEKGWRKNSPYTVKDWHRVAHLVATGRMKRQWNEK